MQTAAGDARGAQVMPRSPTHTLPASQHDRKGSETNARSGNAQVQFALPHDDDRVSNTDAPPFSAPKDFDDLATDRNTEIYHEIGIEVSRFLRRYSKLANLREAVLLVQYKVLHERNSRKDQLNFVRQSHEAFLKEAASFVDPSSEDKSVGGLQLLYKQVADDHQSELQKYEKLSETETEFSNKLYSLDQREHSVYRILDRIANLARQLSPPTISQAETEPSTPSEVSKDELPALIAHYFDKLGDYVNQRDYIREYEVEHREQRTYRMLLAEQGETPSITEEEFEAQFQRKVIENEQELQKFHAKIELARHMCVLEGLDPNKYRKSPSKATRESQSEPSVLSAPASQVADADPLVQEERFRSVVRERLAGNVVLGEPHYANGPQYSDPHSLNPMKAHQLDERVQHWMQDVDDGHHDLQPPPGPLAAPEAKTRDDAIIAYGGHDLDGPILRPRLRSLVDKPMSTELLDPGIGFSPFAVDHVYKSASLPGSNRSRQDAIQLLRPLSEQSFHT